MFVLFIVDTKIFLLNKNNDYELIIQQNILIKHK